jgi:hypothetical protein
MATETKLTAEQQAIANVVTGSLSETLTEYGKNMQGVVDALALGLSERIEQVAADQKSSKVNSDRALGIFGSTVGSELANALSKATKISEARAALLGAAEAALPTLTEELKLEGKIRPIVVMERRSLITGVVALTAAAAGTSFFVTRRILRNVTAQAAEPVAPEAEV